MKNQSHQAKAKSDGARGRRMVFMCLGAVGVACLGYGVWRLGLWARQSPSFSLAEISVLGQTRANAAELRKLSGLGVGQNLFELDVEAAEKAVASHPWIARATVTRRFPHQVSIEVVEHVPVAWVALGELYLLNSEGKPFKKASAEEALDLPLLTGIDREEYLKNPERGAERMLAALQVIDAYNHLPEAKRAVLSEVRLIRDGWVLVVGDGEEIRLGAHDAIERLSQLSLVREALMRQGLSSKVIHLDNRVRPGWVTVQLSAPRSERTGLNSK